MLPRFRMNLCFLFCMCISLSAQSQQDSLITDFARKLSIEENENSRIRDNSVWSRSYPTLKLGYNYSSHHCVEMGIEWVQLFGDYREFFGSRGISAGCEMLFDNVVVFGPKLSAEINLFFVGARVNTIFYTADFKSGTLKIRPEIGLSFLGLMNVFYGRTINCTRPEIYPQKHSISLFFNIPNILKVYGPSN